MKIPDLQLIKQLDLLTQSHKAFALYRLPWTDIPLFVMQDEPVETFSSLHQLNGRKGFVISPFHITKTHPIIIIKPDITAYGWEEIEQRLENICLTEVVPACEEQELDNEDVMKENYTSTFGKFITPLRDNVFKKLVLSRKAKYMLKDDFSPVTAFVTACNSYPRMMISLTHTPVSGTWIGSTPEIIISGKNNDWNTVSLAGTMQMNGTAIPNHWTEKNQEEQALVSCYIKDVLELISKEVEVNGPYTAQAGPLVHLKTDFRFSLQDTSKLGDAMEALYPTPAICGLPKKEAYDFIINNEGYDRSYYSGIIGWLDPEGETNLYVNLRCANISGRYATYYAGGGILSASEPLPEWEETQHKMNTMIRCITNT